jgi:mRNA interferase MazF
MLDWTPARGSEQSGRRPALIIQEDPASSNPNYPLTIVAAVSTSGRIIASHVAIQPSAVNGLTASSYIKCEQIETVSKARLLKRIGVLEVQYMDRVVEALKKVLALP